MIPLNTDVKGLINPSGENDYYKFVITTGGTITLTLTTLPTNYQLSLLNSGGGVLQSSTSGGSNSETINANLAAGTYYARVYPFKNNFWDATNCYTLKVQTGTASKMVNPELVKVSENKFSVFPNPSGFDANLAFSSKVNGTSVVTVINQLGSVV